MLHLLVDTCVWLDLAKDYREQPVISALEDLIAAREIKLVVPQVVLEEFSRNKQRVIEDARRSLQSHFRLVREAVNRFGDDQSRAAILAALNEVDHKIFTGNESVIDSVEKIEELLAAQPALSTTDAIKRAVTERALAGLAPYHRAKNSVGDAILIEIYARMIGSGRKSRTKRFAFVTHNSKDFSQPNGDRRQPHPDLSSLFSPPKSTYWGSLVDLIKDVDSELLADHDSEFNFSHPRRLAEILEAEQLLFRQVWYNRHWNRRIAIKEGQKFLQVVPESE